MGRGRLEAFSDGMMAIFLTIMVLEMRVPHGQELSDLAGVWPVFLSYILSFVYVGIYWSNHHHLLHALDRVNGAILWANMHLMFWLSLIPFTTGWMGENHFGSVPTALYGVVLFMSAMAYWFLERVIIASQGPRSRLKRAIGDRWKDKLSPVIYAVGIALSFWQPLVTLALYAAVAAMWLVPDKRIEEQVEASSK